MVWPLSQPESSEARKARPRCERRYRLAVTPGCWYASISPAATVSGSRPFHHASECARPRPNGPVFRLRYQRADRRTLASELALAAPGSPDFRPVLAEALIRRR